MRYVDLMGGQKPHLLVESINNLGAETRVQYAPSTKFYLARQARRQAVDHAPAVPGPRRRARRDLRPHQPQPLRHPLRLPPRLLRRRRARVPRLRHGRAVGHRGVRGADCRRRRRRQRQHRRSVARAAGATRRPGSTPACTSAATSLRLLRRPARCATTRASTTASPA